MSADKPWIEVDHTRSGVWAIIDPGSYEGDYIAAVYPGELGALRVLNGRGYGRVQFIEFGKDMRGEIV